MGNFKVGDRVVCVDASGKPYSNLRTVKYIVNQVQVCVCGSVSIDVGLLHFAPLRITYCECGNELVGLDVDWCCPQRFRKVEEKKEVNYVKLEIEIEEPCLN